MYPCRLYGNLVTCTQSAYLLSAKAAGYSGTWDTSFPKELLFSWNPFFNKRTGLEGGCRHTPHSRMLTHIQVTQFHILPLQTLSINKQPENNNNFN